MKCERCNGFMIMIDPFVDDIGSSIQVNNVHKCINCGHFDDPIYNENNNKSKSNRVLQKV